MKVARAVKQKRRREIYFVFAVKLGDQTQRRREAQLRVPLASVGNRQAQRRIRPRVIQIEVQRDWIHRDDLCPLRVRHF